MAALGGDVRGAGGMPEVQGFEPAALRPGVATVLRLKGQNLGAARQLWTSWGGWLERRDAEGWEAGDGFLKVPVQVPAEFPAGVECVRVVGTNGVSGPVLVFVDGLPTAEFPKSEDGGGRVIDGVQLPLAVDDVLAEGKSSTWTLRLAAGEKVSLEVVAQRTGAPTDAVVRVLDEAGRELIRANGTPGLAGDCAAGFTAGAAGDYRVEVRDSDYAGGSAFRFRLRLGRFPVAVFPEWGAGALTGQRPESVTWRSGVGERRGSARILESRPGADRGAAAWVRWVVGGPDGPHVVTRRFADLGSVPTREREPNDGSATASELIPGVREFGDFAGPNDRDIYRFEVMRPGRWKVEASGRSLDWPADPLVRLLDMSGRVLATATAGEFEAAVVHRFEKAGSYRVEVEESAGRYGPGRAYLLRATEGAAGFRISTETGRIGVPVGGKQTLKINLEARGYDGPVRFELSGLGEGWSLANPVAEARKKEWSLEVRCAAGVASGEWRRAFVTAAPDQAGESGRAQLELGPALRKAFPRMLSWSPGLAEELWIGSLPAELEKSPTPAGK